MPVTSITGLTPENQAEPSPIEIAIQAMDSIDFDQQLPFEARTGLTSTSRKAYDLPPEKAAEIVAYEAEQNKGYAIDQTSPPRTFFQTPTEIIEYTGTDIDQSRLATVTAIYYATSAREGLNETEATAQAGKKENQGAGSHNFGLKFLANLVITIGKARLKILSRYNHPRQGPVVWAGEYKQKEAHSGIGHQLALDYLKEQDGKGDLPHIAYSTLMKIENPPTELVQAAANMHKRYILSDPHYQHAKLVQPAENTLVNITEFDYSHAHYELLPRGIHALEASVDRNGLYKAAAVDWLALEDREIRFLLPLAIRPSPESTYSPTRSLDSGSMLNGEYTRYAIEDQMEKGNIPLLQQIVLRMRESGLYTDLIVGIDDKWDKRLVNLPIELRTRSYKTSPWTRETKNFFDEFISHDMDVIAMGSLSEYARLCDLYNRLSPQVRVKLKNYKLALVGDDLKAQMCLSGAITIDTLERRIDDMAEIQSWKHDETFNQVPFNLPLLLQDVAKDPGLKISFSGSTISVSQSGYHPIRLDPHRQLMHGDLFTLVEQTAQNALLRDLIKFILWAEAKRNTRTMAIARVSMSQGKTKLESSYRPIKGTNQIPILSHTEQIKNRRNIAYPQIMVRIDGLSDETFEEVSRLYEDFRAAILKEKEIKKENLDRNLKLKVAELWRRKKENRQKLTRDKKIRMEQSVAQSPEERVSTETLNVWQARASSAIHHLTWILSTSILAGSHGRSREAPKQPSRRDLFRSAFSSIELNNDKARPLVAGRLDDNAASNSPISFGSALLPGRSESLENATVPDPIELKASHPGVLKSGYYLNRLYHKMPVDPYHFIDPPAEMTRIQIRNGKPESEHHIAVVYDSKADEVTIPLKLGATVNSYTGPSAEFFVDTNSQTLKAKILGDKSKPLKAYITEKGDSSDVYSPWANIANMPVTEDDVAPLIDISLLSNENDRLALQAIRDLDAHTDIKIAMITKFWELKYAYSKFTPPDMTYETLVTMAEGPCGLSAIGLVACLRAVGIPAIYASGFLNDKDNELTDKELHGFVYVHDGSIWRAIEPQNGRFTQEEIQTAEIINRGAPTFAISNSAGQLTQVKLGGNPLTLRDASGVLTSAENTANPAIMATLETVLNVPQNGETMANTKGNSVTQRLQTPQEKQLASNQPEEENLSDASLTLPTTTDGNNVITTILSENKKTATYAGGVLLAAAGVGGVLKGIQIATRRAYARGFDEAYDEVLHAIQDTLL